MTISDVFTIVRRWWWIVVVAPLAGGVAAFLVSQWLPPTYRATTILLIQQTQNPGTQNYQDLLASQQQTGTYSRWIVTTPILDAAATKSGVVGGSEAIKKKISVSPITNTQLVSVSITDHSAAQAAMIANAIADVFIEQTRNQQSTVTGTSLQEIQRNIDQVKQQVDDTAAQISRLQATPDTSAVNQTQISSLQQQLSQFQATYGSLLQAQQQMAIAQAQLGAQVSVLEPASAPLHRESPRVMLNTALGGAFGLILALGMIGILGYLDNTVKVSEDLRPIIGAGALGSIPATDNLSTMDMLNRPRSAATESFKALRTNLQFAVAGKNVSSLAVTSVRPEDGKSSSSANLAIAIAQGGQRVILVDADLRKPSQHRQFSGISNQVGLTNLLRGTHDQLSDVLQDTQIPGLRVLASGPIPTNPPDVLDSPSMREIVSQLREEADFVIFDTPPIELSDPLIIAGLVDGVLLVVSSGRIRKNDLMAATERLGLTGVLIVGVVLNRVETQGGHYYTYRSDVEIDDIPVQEDPVRPLDSDVTPERRLTLRGWRSTSAQKRSS